MFREALLLLRRSRGERATSLQVRLFAFFALFAAVLAGAVFLILMLTGVWNADGQRRLAWLDGEISRQRDGVSNNYNRLSMRGVSLAKTLSSDIKTWMRENGYSERDIAGHPELLEALLTEQAGSLLTVLENNICSGVFIILDTTINPSADNASASRAGIFFTRRELNNLPSPSPKVYCLRGPASVARANGAELLGQWKMEFDIGGMGFYHTVMNTARENAGADLSRLYYWSGRYLMDGDSETCMMLCLPLISQDGAVYGMCGVVVGDMLFKRQYSPDSSEYPRIFSVIAPVRGDSLDTGAGLVAGNSYLTSHTIGALTRYDGRNGLVSWRSGDGGVYIGRTETLRLYPTGSPFGGETWALSVLIPDFEWDAVAIRGNVTRYGSVIALLIIGLLAAVFISRRYIRPVVSALELIRSDERTGLPKTQIAEINDLFEYLDAFDEKHKRLNEERETLAVELEKTKLKEARQGTAPGTPVFTAYEQFVKNLDTLTATEQAVFSLYMDNYTAQQIADKLFVTINTVKFHNKNIYLKLGVTSLKELRVYVKMMEEMRGGG